MTPEEDFTGQRPHVDHLRMFGCVTFSHVSKEKRTKMEPTAEKGIFVNYSEPSKAYRLYIPGYRTVVVRRYVKFEEDWAFRKSRFSDDLSQRLCSSSSRGVRFRVLVHRDQDREVLGCPRLQVHQQ